jgi:hypothetical protein
MQPIYFDLFPSERLESSYAFAYYTSPVSITQEDEVRVFEPLLPFVPTELQAFLTEIEPEYLTSI